MSGSKLEFNAMCGRYSLTDVKAIAKKYDLSLEKNEMSPRYNAAPSQLLPVILYPPLGQMVMMNWGFLPRWAESTKHPMINARAETVTTKPSFKHAFKSRRCLVLADGFYEWQKTPQGKQPMRFVRKDREPFSMAGIWETWEDTTSGDEWASFAILTTEANKVTSQVHHRMPVILSSEQEKVWLDTQSPLESCLNLCRPYPDEYLSVYPVSRKLNSAQFDDPTLIEEVVLGKEDEDPQMNLF